MEVGEQLPEYTIQAMRGFAQKAGMELDQYKSILGDHTGQLIANQGGTINDAQAMAILQKYNITIDGRRGPVGTLNNITGVQANQQANSVLSRRAAIANKYPSLSQAEIDVIAPAIRELGGELKLGTQTEDRDWETLFAC